MEKEIEIPEGYEAKIDGNKVILVPKESEDEKIRKELLEEIEFIIPHDDETDSEGLMLPSYHARIDRYKSYLERQKEQKPAEWSEEDEKNMKIIIGQLEAYQPDRTKPNPLYEQVLWLKSLRPQPPLEAERGADESS